MGKKPGGGAGWLATVRKVFKPAKSDQRHAKKVCVDQQRGGELEGTAAGAGDAAEIVSVDHFPTAETSPEVINECSGAMGWREREDHPHGQVPAGARRRGRRGMAAASRVARTAASARRRAGSREELAAVRIQAFYRGYLARRARRALRALVQLQALVRGHQVRRQVHLTMRCMQSLVRAQARVRARRLTYDPNVVARPRGAQHRRPGHGFGQQHGGRSSLGYDRVGFDETDGLLTHSVQVQAPAPQRRQGTWDAVTVRADGMSRGHTNESAPTYANGLQHQRQLGELEDRDERSVGWHWLEHCHTGVQARQHAPEEQTNQHGPAETSYVTAAATDSENTVEMEATRKSPTRDLYPVRPPTMPGYMAATRSARAKARVAAPAAPRAGVRSRSELVGQSGGSTSAHMGWSVSNNGGSGCAGTRALQQRAVNSPESSCSGDRTRPASGLFGSSQSERIVGG